MVLKAWSLGLYQSRINSHMENVMTDVEANPATTQASIEGRLTLNATNTALALDALLNQERIVERDDAGTLKYWSTGDWKLAIETNKESVRTHLVTNDPAIFSAIATALTITEAEVEAAVNALVAEGDAFVTEK